MHEVLHKDTIPPEVLPCLSAVKPGYALKRNELTNLLKRSGGVKPQSVHSLRIGLNALGGVRSMASINPYAEEKEHVLFVYDAPRLSKSISVSL